MPKITLYTQVHNAGDYLEPCISSVLAQTFSDFEYIVVDNASTDGSVECLERFAAADSRIRLIKNSENQMGIRVKILKKYAKGEFYAVLDHDDWLEPTFFEQLLGFAEENHLDIACAGTCMHDMTNGNVGYRSVPQSFVLPRTRFAEGYPYYHAFFRTNWGKLIHRRFLFEIDDSSIPSIPYGGDTLHSFHILRKAERIGVESKVLHHYRIHPSSQSYQYSPKRFDADVCLYEDAVDFLEGFGSISRENTLFICRVYANALIDTLGVIAKSFLKPEEKLQEYRRIAEHLVTRDVYKEQHLEIQNSRRMLLKISVQTGCQFESVNSDLIAIMRIMAPHCCERINEEAVTFLVKETRALESLLKDDPIVLADTLIVFVKEGVYSARADLCEILNDILPTNSLLHMVNDIYFLKKHSELCRQLLHENRVEALEQMTGRLLYGQKRHLEESYLQLYLSLAALEGQEPAFVFGKIRLAEWYLYMKRFDDCRNVLEELEEMGAKEHEDVVVLRAKLKLEEMKKKK